MVIFYFGKVSCLKNKRKNNVTLSAQFGPMKNNRLLTLGVWRKITFICSPGDLSLFYSFRSSFSVKSRKEGTKILSQFFVTNSKFTTLHSYQLCASFLHPYLLFRSVLRSLCKSIKVRHWKETACCSKPWNCFRCWILNFGWLIWSIYLTSLCFIDCFPFSLFFVFVFFCLGY